MKQLTCEMCGSTDLLKQDGVFICQSCGTKYSVEEAKKMMIEGTVDVSGSVIKVDTVDRLSNLYQIARRARDDNNSENAAKYYDMILVDDPTSWEASFYVVYFKATSCKIAEIRSAAISVSNCLDTVLDLINTYVPASEQESAVKEVLYRSILISNMLAKGADTHYKGIDSSIRSQYSKERNDNITATCNICLTCGDHIDRIFNSNERIAGLSADAWKEALKISANYSILIARTTYEKKIGKYDKIFYEKAQLLSKKSFIEVSIKSLEKKISTNQSEGNWHDFGLVAAIILSAVWLIVAIWAFDTEVYGGAIVCLLLGAASCIPMFIWGNKASKKASSYNITLQNDLKAKKAELESVIKELKKYN